MSMPIDGAPFDPDEVGRRVKNLQVSIPPYQKTALVRLSRATGTSLGALVSEALESHLELPTRPPAGA